MPRKSQSNNRGGNRGRRSNNNNPEGYNQHNSGWMDTARERPVAAAAAAAAAVGAGVFLWSKRGQISDQLAQISDQIGEWTESSNREFESVGVDSDFSASSATGTAGQTSGMGKTPMRSGRGTSGGGRRSPSVSANPSNPGSGSA